MMITFAHTLAQWIDAEARSDAAALDVLLGADFRGDGPRGHVLGKQEWLDRYRTRDLVVGALAWKVASLLATARPPSPRGPSHTSPATGASTGAASSSARSSPSAAMTVGRS
jgi:hypothetical protein